MNIIAQGLNFEPGDRIIPNDIEFPSNVYPLLNLQSKGVEIDFVESKNGIIKPEDIIKIAVGYKIFIYELSRISEILGNC